MTCHSRAAGFLIGLTGHNTNRNRDYGSITDNQLRTLSHIGLFNNPPKRSGKPAGHLVNPYNISEDLEKRARSYLHINCAVCHVEAGGGNSMMELGLTTSRRRMRLIEARPQHDTFGIANAMLVSPGVPEQSVLLQRLNRRGRGQMPPLVSGAVDYAAVELFGEWISGMKPSTVFVKNWKMADLEQALGGQDGDRSLASGKVAFDKSGCAQCHRFKGSGGSVGPDLTGLVKRMKPLEVLESILEPSRTIDEAYSMQQFTMSDGAVHLGQVQEETDAVVRLRSLSATSAPVTLAKALIESRKKLDVSNMPPGMVNTLTEQQILDLVAYLLD
jgi:putative heme-binding domain-containing protein